MLIAAREMEMRVMKKSKYYNPKTGNIYRTIEEKLADEIHHKRNVTIVVITEIIIALAIECFFIF